MQQGRPTALSVISKEVRINQLKEQIKILRHQLEMAERDLHQLEKQKE